MLQSMLEFVTVLHSQVRLRRGQSFLCVSYDHTKFLAQHKNLINYTSLYIEKSVIPIVYL